MLKKYWDKIFVQTFRQTEAESAAWLDSDAKSRADFRTMVILLYVPLALSLNYYFASSTLCIGSLHHLGLHETAQHFSNWINHSENVELRRLIWWASFLLLTYLVFPALIIRFVFRERLPDYGFRLRGALRDYHLYIVMLIVMVPLVLFFSGTKSFQERYPFYQPAPQESLWPDFWTWEFFYFLQFIGVEFFFRGFMTIGLRKRMGFYSVFVMTIPYCMIHFGKPFPETISAILAGVVLGTLSLKSRSVFLGVFIHYSVAITMDLCALWREGYF